MKFRFAGDLDCPDWVLAEIATISKISSIKAKQLCALIVNSILTQDALQSEKLEKLATDAKLESNDIKACVALLEFIVISAAKYTCNSETLSSELQQLGLPKEHSTSICKVYEDNHAKLEDLLKKTSLRINPLEDYSWRVDYVFGSSFIKNINQPIAHIKLKINNSQTDKIESHVISLNSDKLKLLISELKEAQNFMKTLDESSSSLNN